MLEAELTHTHLLTGLRFEDRASVSDAAGDYQSLSRKSQRRMHCATPASAPCKLPVQERDFSGGD